MVRAARATAATEPCSHCGRVALSRGEAPAQPAALLGSGGSES